MYIMSLLIQFATYTIVFKPGICAFVGGFCLRSNKQVLCATRNRYKYIKISTRSKNSKMVF